MPPPTPQHDPPSELRDKTHSAKRAAVAEWFRDFGRFLREQKLWWLLPLVAMIVLVLLLASLTREPERPPTYPHF